VTTGEASRPNQVKHRKRTPGSKVPASEASAPSSGTADPPASAFDVWLERGLHKLFDDVASEPIPPELLQLIEGDRAKQDANEPKIDDTT